MMNPRERMKRIEELFQAALEQPAAQRSAFLARACAADPALRVEVESLLAAHEQPGTFLAHPLRPVPVSEMQATHPLAGKQISNYRILTELGRGGMGKVYLAEDVRLGRRLAVKVLYASSTGNPDALRRFEREARTASSLNHPNIVTIYEVGVSEGEHFIAAEFVEGETLRQRISQQAIPLDEVLEIAIQVSSALAAAHEADIVHRDIKPENVMLRRDGYVKVLDFGLAKLIDRHEPHSSGQHQDSGSTVTEPGTIIGTTAYMSPEQARGHETDHRSDIFAFGIMLYEMVAGARPFPGNSKVEILSAILEHYPTPLARYVHEFPAELERILIRMLAKKREERYQSTRDLMLDLKNLKLDLEVSEKIRLSGNNRTVTPEIIRSFDTQEQTSEEKTPYLITRRSHETNVQSFEDTPTSQSKSLKHLLEPVGGAVPLDSRFYIQRGTDEKFRAAIERKDSIVLVKGARQVGKTSLLARGLQQARESGAKVVLSDFQNLSTSDLESTEKLFRTLGDSFADQLELDVDPADVWREGRSPSINFEQYLRREVLNKINAPIVWGLDEVDRLFTCSFGSEVFGLFRSWHNKRALDPSGPWRQMTLAIAYATEAHLFITDLNQSPFNVGTRLQLEDFTFDQVSELNVRYDSPLKTQTELDRFYQLLSGHPFLVRRGLHEMAANDLDLNALDAESTHDDGPFGDHLRRIHLSLSQDSYLANVVRTMLQGRPCPTADDFYRLRSAGIIIGETAGEARLRCQLYATFLQKHLQ